MASALLLAPWILSLPGAGAASEPAAQSALIRPATPIGEEANSPVPLCAGPAVLVTLDGERLETARGFAVDGNRVRYQNAAGTLVAVRLSEIDSEATTAAERHRCGAETHGDREAPRATRRDPIAEVIEAIVKLGVNRTRLETLAADPVAFRATIDAVVSMAAELELRTREIERNHRLDTVGGMLTAAPAYRRLATLVRDTAAREEDPRIRAVLEDLAVSFDEVARLAAEDPERAIEEFRRQGTTPP